MTKWVNAFLIFSIITFSMGSRLFAQSETNQSDQTKGTLCVPEYSSGCGFGDGFTSFAVEEIQNYNTGCADNTGFEGWSQYLELGPAMLMGGQTYDFMMQSDYADQFVSIWIDFNDDFILTPDEMIMDGASLESSGQLYTVQATIPPTAQNGLHIMRARTNWQNTADDPCAEYGYGEAEDYMVFIGEAAFGSLEGIVTTLDGGDPVEGAEIILDGPYSYSGFSSPDGTYQIENVLVGEYDVECFKEGFNSAADEVTIEEGFVATTDFQLTQPNISVDPLSVSKVLAPNSTGEETFSIENSGNGELTWSASIMINTKDTREYLDLQFQYSAEGSGSEAGIESDGNFIYTTQWNSNAISKYDLDGNFVEEFTIPDTYFIRDLAFDGTYFYGGASTSEVYEMDFVNQDLVSTFTAPTNVRAIAYNAIEDVFYANDWNTPVITFDRAGAELESFNVGPVGGEYYGFAFDNTSPGGPFLWGYAQIGNKDNELIQMQLPSGNETGFTLDVTTKLSGFVWGDAGGLFTHPHLVTGKTTLGGMVQGEWLWGLELGDATTWLSVNPIGGTIEAGNGAEATIMFDATDLEVGEYEAEIHINTWPDIGTPVINVTLTVSEIIPDPPYNFSTLADCDTLELCWEANVADSFSVYNNNVWVANTINQCYTFAGPGMYESFVTAWFGGIESGPSETVPFEILVPEDMEPVNFAIDEVIGSIVNLSWDIPSGCAVADGYNVYRDGSKINANIITELSFVDTMDIGGTYEYWVTAVYYFGESDPSNSESVVLTSIQEQDATGFSISPNPFSDIIVLEFMLPDPGDVEIIIYNQNGNRINNFSKEGLPFGKQSIGLDTSDLSSGIYFCVLKTRQGKQTKKLIKL